MSQVSLTYNPIEDRVLLIVSSIINHPQWWLSRQMCKKLLETLDAELSLQHDLENIQASQHNNAKINNIKSIQKIRPALNDTDNCELHKKLIHNKAKTLLTTRISLDKKPDDLVALYLYSYENQGVCLDLDNNGLHIFIEMMSKVTIKAGWNIRQAQLSKRQ